MPKSAGQKLKLLYIVKILEEHTDENHPMSTAELIRRLEEEGIHAERKSIYDDIARLIDFGYDIIAVQSRLGGGYYMAGREFELAELKLLVDAVQSSRFITTRKSRELIRKLENKAGKHDAGKLRRQVYVAGRVKTENENIYYSVDAIHRAIQENRQITFVYLDWNEKKELVPRQGGERCVSPWALLWKEENYYLLAYDKKEEKMKHYRVDKIGQIHLLDAPRDGREVFERIDLAAYTNQTFGMFGGQKETVSIVFPRRLLGVVLDRFGKDVDLRPLEDGCYRVRAQVAVSGQFFGWLAGVGREVQVIAPEAVKEAYRQYLTEILEAMGSAPKREVK